MVRKFVLLATASLVFAAAPTMAQDASNSAQAPAQDAAPEATAGFEETMVTAQKREEKLQYVPVSVTALSAQALATNPANVVYQVLPRDSRRFFGIELQYTFGN